MSHIVEAQTAIQNPDAQLLRQAVELVAQQHAGGHLESYYLDYNHRRHECPLSLFTDWLGRGIGIKVDQTTGALTFVGDSWGVEDTYELVQQQILQMYVSLATMKALQEMGYTAQAIDGEAGTGQVVVQGVSYA